MSYAVVESLRIYPLEIPLRTRVSHAASVRGVSDSIVVAVDLYNDVTGYGETLPRKYVTGESVESVVEDISTIFLNQAKHFNYSLICATVPWPPKS